MPGRSLHIAWLGSAPLDTGGAPGVVAELLEGLARRGHRIDCFFPAAERALPPRFAELEGISYVWGTSEWRWASWYNRLPVTAFASGLLSRALASLRLRRQVSRRHRRDPYDLIFQNSTIESLAVPNDVAREIPLVLRPDTHLAGELRWQLAERRLAFASQPRYVYYLTTAIMAVRTLVQRFRIRRADLLVCISEVFRDHMVADYGFPVEATTVIANPIRVQRFTQTDRTIGEPPTVLVMGRVSVRKGLEDVLALARMLLARGAPAHIRVVGGPSMWSDYSKLLEDLPSENAEFVGRVHPSKIPAELAAADVLLQASKYEPFGLTVAEALAAGVPVVATREVGAAEGVDESVAAVCEPGDVAGIADAVLDTFERLRADPVTLRSHARAEAERLFTQDVICERLSQALVELVERRTAG